ncbi:MAG: translation initiation factor IF-2 N-terminal domain-containing protein, partial [Solirubrobacterales bacterium]
MSRKRVYEIAKEQGVTSKDLLAALAAAGIEAKAAASSVDEGDALKALGNGAGNPTAEGERQAAEPTASKPKQAAKPKSSKPVKPGSDGKAASNGTKAAGGSKKRRRVVIDSNASRRDQGGPPPPQRPPRRRGGRRRKPVLEEPTPVEKEPEAPQATRVNSGVTVRELAELLDLSSADLIKKLMSMGEMATLTQTLTDESVEALAGEYDRKIEIVSAAEEEPDLPPFEDAEDSLED